MDLHRPWPRPCSSDSRALTLWLYKATIKTVSGLPKPHFEEDFITLRKIFLKLGIQEGNLLICELAVAGEK